jgi:hypothetical protein
MPSATSDRQGPSRPVKVVNTDSVNRDIAAQTSGLVWQIIRIVFVILFVAQGIRYRHDPVMVLAMVAGIAGMVSSGVLAYQIGGRRR